MPTITELLTDIDLRYRNSFTTDQKVKWMNIVQVQIFQKVRHEAEPFYFTTVATQAFYPLPSDCDFKGVKQVAIETKASSGEYRPLEYVSVESTERFSEKDYFYSIQGESNLFLNPIPTSTDEGKRVYIYYNKKPAELSSSNTSATPDLEENFHELLVLGTLERIAMSRGEYEDKNNFANDFNLLLREYVNQYKLMQPEYYKTKDTMPYRKGTRYMSRYYRDRLIDDYIPY